MSRRKPSPSMVVALVALFVALGGSSYAALRIGSTQIRNNTIKSIDVKNRSLKGADVANRTITAGKLAANSVNGSKIVDGAVTGAEVDENTLGPVPNATNAANAVNAANATNAVNATNATNAGNADTLDTLDSTAFELTSKTLRLGVVKLVDGDDRDLGTFGTFALRGTCEHDGAGNELAALTITSSQDNSTMNADDTEEDFDAGETFEFVQAAPTAGTPLIDSADDATAIAADGTIVSGLDVFAGVDVLDAECVVGGTLRLG